jgi:hypothetical protein
MLAGIGEKVMTIAKELIQTNTLADWTRRFAQETLPVCDIPPVGKIRQVIATYLPQVIAGLPQDATAEQWCSD